jgi:hypothetical protein
MLNLIKNKYFVVGNLTFTAEDLQKLPDQENLDIQIQIPQEFRCHKGKKFIMFYGCTLTYSIHYKSGDEQVLTESTYTPQHATVHSNLPNLINTKAEIDMSRIQLHPENPPTHLNRYHDYVSTANNCMLQKLYEVPAGMVDQLRFHFIDKY